MASTRLAPISWRAFASIQSLQPLRLNQTPITISRLNPRKQSIRQPSTPLRPYHSTLHPRLPDHEYTNSQSAILTAALPHIPSHGFTLEALTLGARDAGFLDVSVQLLPRAEFDLILFWLASRRGILRAKVEEGALFTRVAAETGRDAASLSVEEKSKILVLERLAMNKDIKGQWQDVCLLFPCYPIAFILRVCRSEAEALSILILTRPGPRSNVPSIEYSHLSNRTSRPIQRHPFSFR